MIQPMRSPLPDSRLESDQRALKQNMSFIQSLRSCLDDLLDTYSAAAGVGADAYWKNPRVHPMADGKYLLSIVQSYRAGLIGQSRAIGRAKPAAKRLKDRALPLSEDRGETIGWGLGFPWAKHTYTAQDPLLITSAVCTKALSALVKDELLPAQFEMTYTNALKGLHWWSDEAAVSPPNGPSLPCYGLSNYREPVHNTAAYSLGLLFSLGNQASEEMGHRLTYIADQYTNGAGWVYSYDNPVIDLLHQWYILNPLIDSFGAERFEEHCQTIVSQFGTGDGFLDVATLKPSAWRAACDDDPGYVLARPIPTGTLLVNPKPARLWSLGEMLVGVSKMCQQCPSNPLWPRYGQMIAKLILDKSQTRTSAEWAYPRHTMHLAHGLAAYIAFRRGETVI